MVWLKQLPALATGLILLIFVFYGSTLSATPKIQVTGQNTDRTLVRGLDAYQQDVAAVLSRSITNRSKLLIDTDKVASELKQEYPELGTVSVVLPLASRRPIVEVSPAKPALILASSDGAFVVDQEGRAIIKTADVESSIKDALPVVQDQSGLSLERGKSALPKETVTFVSGVAAQLAAKNISVQSLVLPPNANQLDVRLAGQTYFIKMDTRGESRQTVGTFIAVKERLEHDHKVPAEYIDVRVPEKAFYK